MNNETNKVYIELVTSSDVEEFCRLCNTVDSHDIYVKGFDEFGKPWQMNAKSFLGTLTLTAIIEEQIATVKKNKEKAEKRGIVDWNTIYAESTYPNLYTLLSKFAR